jgi:putative peptidoglycan lipid II flippase
LSAHKHEILKSAGLITALTVVSRILGYLRDQRIALLLGTTVSGDAFVLAYRIPNLLRRLVAEGSMSASFVPVFAEYLTEKDRKDVWDFANRMFWTLSFLLALAAVLGVIFSPAIVGLFTLGHSRIPVDKAVFLNRLMFPYIFFIGMSALAMAILNSFKVFGLPAFTPALLNLSIITFSFFPWFFGEPEISLALGVLIGGMLQMVVQLPWLWKQGMRFTFGISFSHPGIRRVGKLMLPGIVGISVAQINFFVDTVFATQPFLPVGSLVSLQFADRVMELVLGGYAIAVGTAILPMMSRHVAEKKPEELKRTLAFSLRIVSFITVPAMVGLILLRQPIIQVLFQHGRFDASSTQLTAWALWLYSIGLPWFAATKILVPAFYSTQDTKTPVRVAVIAMVANVILNFLFIKPLQNGGPALATSLAGVLNFVLLYRIFSKRYGDVGGRAVLEAVGRIIVASAGMGLVTWGLLHWIPFVSGQPLWWRAGLLTFLLTVSTGVYFALAWVLHCEELSDIYGIARRKKGPQPPVSIA